MFRNCDCLGQVHVPARKKGPEEAGIIQQPVRMAWLLKEIYKQQGQLRYIGDDQNTGHEGCKIFYQVREHTLYFHPVSYTHLDVYKRQVWDIL